MGVQGLWHLLQPCGRPTKLESLEGRRLAIDSSIWLYHFQMAMRDKEGRTLSNAHILGFLWRILKLVHFGIRPIFVFDGGAPVLKRKTLSGRKQRKTGARDDHRRVAERLLHARMREAAIAHVSKGGEGTGTAEADQEDGDHGLGENVRYMDDVTGVGGTNSIVPRGDALDDGSISRDRAKEKEKEAEAAKKKKRDQWQKDPYALPALNQEISTITADNSAAVRKGRGGGKRPDIRFATEGELRSLLSSIQPTDLDLDSDFFRSLPTELQYELVGDLRAASRGTSYKRLQSMLASSPTPIDFSRAQIAGLKTRNELTQKVLEVTDEIGDAHIKVPIRVAGARNREYVLIRNKGGQAGFVLGVRETGTTQDKAIAVDEDSASATTNEDEMEKRHTDEEIDLEDVDVESSPMKAPVVDDALAAMREANPNDPMARKQVARELLQRRARELAKEKAKEQGLLDEEEIMEEQLRQMQTVRKGRTQNKRDSARSGQLFLPNEYDLEQIGAEVYDDEYELAGEEKVLESASGSEFAMDEAEDLAKALEQSEKEIGLSTEHGSDDDDEIELDEVDTNGLKASDYSMFHRQPSPAREGEEQVSEWLSERKTNSKVSQALSERVPTPPSRDTTPTRTRTGIPGLGFRVHDKEGYPERLNPALLKKMQWNEEREDDEASSPLESVHSAEHDQPTAISISDTDSLTDHSPLNKARELMPVLQNAEHPLPPDQVTSITSSNETKNEVKVVDFASTPNKDVEHAASPQNISPPTAPDSHVRKSKRASSEYKSLNATKETKEADQPDGSTTIDIQSSPKSSDSVTEQRLDPAPNAASESQRGEQRSVSSSPELARREPFQDEEERVLALERLQEEPAFDNLISMAKEDGDVADLPIPETDTENDVQEGDTMVEDAYSPDWSRSPTPADEDQIVLGPDGFPLPTAEELEAMEAEDELDLGELEGDQDEFVSFLSRAKGRGLHEVRKEVEDEVSRLRSEHATTRRSEGDVTQQMAKEIQLMLRLFGLPYITAPMEAEAQCAELVSIGLADGIITDDSDVFLFGGTFIYKNMFNNKKYVECYKLSDLQHDLGMDRTKLVQLAYLLGSDYTDGLEGVGPVLAMEILSNFQGDDALIKFREWWLKVQVGNDTPRDTCNTTLKRVKRTLRNKVHLNDTWPDEHVLNAYYEPVVDSSDEAFQWGLPDLDSLRSFFSEYLHWDREKTDHYLVPAIEEQNRRSRRTQGTLDNSNFFDLSAGQGAYAGRQRPGFNSSRLQQVITNFRNSKKAAERKHKRGGADQEAISVSEDEEESNGEGGAQAIPEQRLGKEMGNRSRPIVSRKRQQDQQEGDENVAEGGEGVAERNVNQKHERAPVGKRGRNGKGPKAKRGRKQADTRKETAVEADSDGSSEASRHAHDEEWRPRQAKTKKRKTGPAEGALGTRLTQARKFNLDDVHSLPPSRARGMRTPSEPIESPSNAGSRGGDDQNQKPIAISEDESSSDLSV